MHIILRYKKQIMAAASICVSVCLILWLLSRVDYDQTRELLRVCNKSRLLLAALFIAGIPFFCVIRWTGVLRSRQNIRIPYLEAFYAVMIANILNSFMPSKAGEIAKAAFIREHCRLSSGIAMVILERLVDFSILGTLGIIGFFGSGILWGLISGLLLLSTVALIFALAVFLPFDKIVMPWKLGGFIKNVIPVFRDWISNPTAIVQTVAGSLGCWILAGISICALSSAISPGVKWGHILSIYPVAILAGLVPISISGIGPRDSAFVLLLSSRMSVEEATLIGLGYTVLGYWFVTIFGFAVCGWGIVRFAHRQRGLSEARMSE